MRSNAGQNLGMPKASSSCLDPYGFSYYAIRTRVECGSGDTAKIGYLTGGHYNRKIKDPDVRVLCGCGECEAIGFSRWICTQWEKHAGAETSKNWRKSIKVENPGGQGRKAKTNLVEWIKAECILIGDTILGHKVKVWWPGGGKYYHGIVKAFNEATAEHTIHYDDKEIERLWMVLESYVDLGPDKDWKGPEPPADVLPEPTPSVKSHSSAESREQSTQSSTPSTHMQSEVSHSIATDIDDDNDVVVDDDADAGDGDDDDDSADGNDDDDEDDEDYIGVEQLSPRRTEKAEPASHYARAAKQSPHTRSTGLSSGHTADTLSPSGNVPLTRQASDTEEAAKQSSGQAKAEQQSLSGSRAAMHPPHVSPAAQQCSDHTRAADLASSKTLPGKHPRSYQEVAATVTIQAPLAKRRKTLRNKVSSNSQGAVCMVSKPASDAHLSSPSAGQVHAARRMPGNAKAVQPSPAAEPTFDNAAAAKPSPGSPTAAKPSPGTATAAEPTPGNAAAAQPSIHLRNCVYICSNPMRALFASGAPGLCMPQSSQA